jgi:hypothetical protein
VLLDCVENKTKTEVTAAGFYIRAANIEVVLFSSS